METTPRRTQRLGAYAVILATDPHGVEHVLLTQISERGYPPRWWALPGGGVDHGESPGDAVVREVHEESGVRVLHHRLVAVHDVHIVERGRDDVDEDYHGVHLLYAARIAGQGLVPLEVVEQDGTTELARWLPTATVLQDPPGPLLPAAVHALERLGDYRSASSGTAASLGSIGPSSTGPVDPCGT